MTTTALVPVFTGDNGTTLCNARDLHAVLESGQDFSDWIKNRIEKYGFIEGEDFSINFGKTSRRGGRPATDYHLTLDMAKELAMVENNERGRQVRRYFIALEKAARAKHSGGDTAARALPAPADRLTPHLRRRINRKAHEIALRQYDTIHAIITGWARDNLACGATEEACEGYIDTAGELADGTVIVNLRDLQEIVLNSEQVINTAASAIAAIHRIEQRSGLKLALRTPRHEGLPADWRKLDRLVQEVLERMT